MSQECKCYLDFGGPLDQRLAAARDALGVRAWDWLRVEVNARPDGPPWDGSDSGRSVMVFCSTGFPVEIRALAPRFPDLTFDCTCLDLAANVLHELKLRGTEEWDVRESPVSPGGPPGSCR